MDPIEEVLTRGVENVYPTRQELEKVLRSGKKLKLYQGFDPTGDKLHLGHMIGLRKLRQFQKLGHHVIFLIGDGTGQAGDPSGKFTARNKFMTQDQLRQNAADYVKQAANIVDFKGNISNEKLSQLLPDYNLLVLPSEFETFGIVIIEAMACGIPVIATNISAMPEIVSNDEVGTLFNLGNIEELTMAIEKAISKPWNKQVIHDHAMTFSIVETAKNIDQMYNKLL